MGTVFLQQSTAHSVLRRLRRANYLLEEVKQGNIQRECREEVCNYEEAREAFENDEKTRRFWEEYVRENNPNKGLESMVGSAQSLYLILPLLLVLLLIMAVTITVWRCHSRKRSQRSPSAGRSHREPTLSVVSMDQWGPEFHSDMSPRSDMSARSYHAGSGRTSAGDPPPSYDEAVGQADVHIETEPPPQYDDIVNNSSSNMIIGQGK
ncbi:transmembrane gamma-carboxyglutamic acid protein 1 [Sardina pilchardus]|uniref:transmembrane gamma-carboxyglutamic acid protein 1 n=1 Tax=Sardina pilchardus TaxID=27697 RepID=UPI002E120063